MDGERLRFQLELDRISDAIAGRLSAERGETIFFTGWLELISALEQARTEARGLESARDNRRRREDPARGVDDPCA